MNLTDCIAFPMTNDRQPVNLFSVVAIDGGAASGKSSTSARLAKRCNFLHVDTGSHYRAVTHVCLDQGLDAVETPALKAFLADLTFTTSIRGHEALICVAGAQPLTNGQLRSPMVNAWVSPFSALPAVRQAVKAYQRQQVDVARANGFSGIVMDGRDIGTVILPNADLKIFLKADPDTRQRRRLMEGAADKIGDRDKRDASRATAPMKAADDAIVIDNSHMPLEQVVEHIIALLPHADTR